ncbi:pumilio homolog 12-like [Punica granatum]|uniref:Pumilio homolog 12-like n=1 Tax=Punica granatum TaxID=22663 RepID=A0A218X5Z8_PUNGR|nr:pumilio homolog 12-like [Punica granatum]OWM80655.1 hypothetical protein CDL15_Pgr006685 [Punica granatum]
MNGGGDGEGPSGSGYWLRKPRTVKSNPSSPRRSFLDGPYADQTLGPATLESAARPVYRPREPMDYLLGDELAGVLQPFSLIDDTARRLEMLSFGNGAADGDSTLGLDYGPYRSMPGSPVYANPVCSPRFQSAVLNHYAEYHRNGAGLFCDSSGQIDWTVGANTNCFWPNRHNRTYSPLTYVCPGLRSLQGRIAEVACDQDRCKALQWKIEQGLDEEEIQILFREIIEDFVVLTTHKCGNYVVQQFIELCSEQQRNLITLMLTAGEAPLIFYICCDQYGTRVIQKLLDNATTPHIKTVLLSTIAQKVAELVKNPNGRHVITHCLEKFSNEDNEFLYREVAENCDCISTDRSGCCVIQKCVDYTRGEQRKMLVDAIIAQALYLSMNEYGNYVVQHILKLKVPGFTTALIKQLEGNFVFLSCDKYASNVVECCFRESGIEHFIVILDELLRDPIPMAVFLDPFGNYVFTSAVEVSRSKGFDAIFHMLQGIIQRNAKLINGHFHGKKAATRLGKAKLLLPDTAAALKRF